MSNTSERIEIPLSKSKLFGLLAGSIGFIAIGIWLVYTHSDRFNNLTSEQTIMIALGILSVLFFGLCAYYLLKKLRDQRPGLIIDDHGLTDNTSGVSAGPIPWEDIEAIKVIEISRQKLIMIIVTHPEHYIERETNRFKRSVMKMNHSMYGSPVCITANTLKMEFDALYTLLTDRLQESYT